MAFVHRQKTKAPVGSDCRFFILFACEIRAADLVMRLTVDPEVIAVRDAVVAVTTSIVAIAVPAAIVVAITVAATIVAVVA